MMLSTVNVRRAAWTVRGLAGTPAASSSTLVVRVQREDGVALTADDHHEERGRQSDEDEDG